LDDLSNICSDQSNKILSKAAPISDINITAFELYGVKTWPITSKLTEKLNRYYGRIMN